MKRIAIAFSVLVVLFFLPASAQAQQRTVTLAWTPSVVAPSTPPAPVLSVTIYRGTATGAETKLVNVPIASLPTCPATVPAGSQCFTDATVANSTTYFYQVTSTNSSGESGKSNEFSIAIPLPLPTVPPAPTNLTGTVSSP